MDLLSDLTPAQCEAVTHWEGPLLVLAAAGSGKTRVITRRIANMLRQGIPGNQILALTFTNKAAGEMRQRVASLVPDSGVWLGTFHALCARLLRQYAPLVGINPGFTIYDQADRLRVIKAVMEQPGMDPPGITPERVEQAISRAKNDLVGPADYRDRGGDEFVGAAVRQIYSGYQERLRAASAVDFDDLLYHLVRILKQHSDVRAALDRRFRYILVDEYQDTNLAQYAILRAISLDYRNLCVTGDPDQSIYGWRGANLDNILKFENDYPGCKVVTLERNYRSTKNILLVADHLIRHNKKRKHKGLSTENPEGSPVSLTRFGDEQEESQALAGKILELVEDGGDQFGDIAVFVRMSALTRPLESAFRAAQIPYRVVGGQAFFERQEIKDVLSYLNLVANPRDDLAFLRVVNLPPRGLGKTSIEAVRACASERQVPLLEAARQARQISSLTARATQALETFVRLIDELIAARDRSAEEFLRLLLDRTGYHKYLSQGEKAEDRVANVDELVSAAREFDQANPEGGLSQFQEQISLASAVDQMTEESGAVTLMTLHAAKGLEFPVVFLIAVEEGILPHGRALSSPSELEEERRLLFVGMTRAQRELYLSHCVVREFRGQRNAAIPSSFLSELPLDEMEVLDRGGRAQRFAAPPRPGYGYAPRNGQRRGPGHAWNLTTAASLGGGTTTSGTGRAGDSAELRPGVMVLHPQYGLGRIVAIDGAGPNRKGRVAFAVGGERSFVLAKADLKPIGGR